MTRPNENYQTDTEEPSLGLPPPRKAKPAPRNAAERHQRLTELLTQEPSYAGDEVRYSGLNKCDRPRKEERVRVRIFPSPRTMTCPIPGGYVIKGGGPNDVLLYRSELEAIERSGLVADKEEPERIRAAQAALDQALAGEVHEMINGHAAPGFAQPLQVRRRDVLAAHLDPDHELHALVESCYKKVLDTTALSLAAMFHRLFEADMAPFERIEVLGTEAPPRTAIENERAQTISEITPGMAAAMSSAMESAVKAAVSAALAEMRNGKDAK